MNLPVNVISFLTSLGLTCLDLPSCLGFYAKHSLVFLGQENVTKRSKKVAGPFHKTLSLNRDRKKIIVEDDSEFSHKFEKAIVEFSWKNLKYYFYILVSLSKK